MTTKQWANQSKFFARLYQIPLRYGDDSQEQSYSIGLSLGGATPVGFLNATEARKLADKLHDQADRLEGNQP